MRTGLALTKIALTLLAKSVLIPLGLTAATSAVVAAIKKNFFFGSGMTVVTISNGNVDDIMKIVKSLEESG